MRGPSREVPGPRSRFSVKRSGLASLLFALFRPREARAAMVNADSVRLSFGSRLREIELRISKRFG